MHLYPSIEHGGMPVELSSKKSAIKPQTEREKIEDEMEKIALQLTGSCYSKKMLERWRELKSKLMGM